MTPAAMSVLAELRAAGLRLEAVDPDGVHVRPLGLLTPERRRLIVANKPAIRAALDLERRIRAMAARWEYAPEELEWALEDAQRNPAGWLNCCAADEELTTKSRNACVSWPI